MEQSEVEAALQGSASRYQQPLRIGKFPAPAVVPWIFVGIGWSFLFRMEVIVPLLAYSIGYGWLAKRGFTLAGIRARLALWYNDRKANVKP